MKLRNMTSLYLCGDTGIWCLYRMGSRVADRKYIGSAGGHFEEGELNDPERCVLRELREELGLTREDLTGLSMRYVTHRLKNGEIRQNYYFLPDCGKSALWKAPRAFCGGFPMTRSPSWICRFPPRI